MAGWEELDEAVAAALAETGWIVTYVPPGEDEDQPSFHFTTGLTDYERPELIVYSLPYEVGGALLNAVAAAIFDRRVDARGHVRGLEGPALMLLDARKPPHPLGLAEQRYGDDFRLQQVVFPDRGGRWPWEPDFERPTLTPLLFTPPSNQ